MAGETVALPLTSCTDDVLRARLRRAAQERMDSTSPHQRALAGQTCLDVVTELQRRRVPLWHAPDAGCACAAPTALAGAVRWAG